MFKKIISIILALVFVLSFAGCTQKNADSDSSASGSAGSNTEESTSSQEIDTDEKLLTVEITIPASIFAEEDMSTFDPDAYAAEQGFISAKVNDDDSVTITMSKAKHKELLDELETSLDTSFAEFVNGENTPYIKDITHNDDFSAVTMKVDREAYENAFDFTPFAIGVLVAWYQAFTETECHVTISIVDVATGETMDTITYPDDLTGLS